MTARWNGVGAAGLLLAVQAQAQVVPPDLPAQFDPGLQRGQQEQILRQQEVEERARRLEIPALQGEAPEAQQLPSSGERFVLQGIHFNPSVFIEAPTLQAMAADYIGKPISFADINELLRKLNALYEEAGQLTARAVVPPQSVDNGVLSVVLVEAKVDGFGWEDAPRHVDEAFYHKRIRITPGETLDSPA